MTHVQCGSDECDSTTFHVDELVPGQLTLFCAECGERMPLSEEHRVYADFRA